MTSHETQQATEAEAGKAKKPGTDLGDAAEGTLDLLDVGGQLLGACVDAARVGAAGAEVVASGALEVAKVAGEATVAVVGAVGEALSALGDIG